MKNFIFALVLFVTPFCVKADDFLGKTPIATVTHSYVGGGAVTTAAWTELVSSIPSKATFAQIQDTSGQILKLAVGAAGSEVEMPLLIMRGGNGNTPLNINYYQRISIKAVSANATAGEITINFYQ